MLMKKLSLLFALVLLFMEQLQAQTGPITLVIHGGAGNITPDRITPDKQQAYEAALQESLRVGYAVLERGGTSLDAVEAAIRVMEDNPLFNAGKGAVFTAEGRNELDAAIMDGRTGKAGSVAGVATIRNPVSAARAVMEKSPHVMMTGPGAEVFAKEQGLETVSPEYFKTEARYQEYLKAKERETKPAVSPAPAAPAEKPKDNPVGKPKKKSTGGSSRLEPYLEGHKFGTVGAVALDAQGNLAAATSTGGMTMKRYGRVGDAPIIGAGTFADNATCAVSATGHGEYFIRSVVAHDISALMAYKGLTVQQASEEVVMKKLVERGGEGGVIALDRKGNWAMPFNSSGMFRGSIQKGKEPEVKIFK
jgi:beta-aspartyl-peptidase (threonine type)